MKRLGIAGVTFHDLRGTGVSYCHAMGVDIGTIAMISGHSEAGAEAIIRKHYLAGQEVVEAIRQARTGTEPVKRARRSVKQAKGRTA